METDLELAQRAALTGAAEALRHFAVIADLPRETKKDGSVVTLADRAVENAIRGVLTEARPQDAILGEEHGETASGNGRRWIIDPIDGTALFVRGDDRWLVLIALEVDGEVTTGVQIVPAQGLAWWAQRGAGAYRGRVAGGALVDAERIHVAAAHGRATGSRLGVVPLDWGREVAAPLVAVADERTWPIHPPLLVAQGDLDVAVQTGGQIWDFAASSVIIPEAGGVFRGLDGSPRPGAGPHVFASNPALLDEALRILH
ncbi:histidinol phosphate phosphatase [Actinoplanes sp. SE50]|uniref:inositol monophosphatase family protein n=1 Tax=unclassified Actinoplanes TaxID=2626549 RepID=UPI00023ED0DF|nr:MULTISPECIES: inositol monophosphatase family protein [unclassified Actinoplanes]AEV86101.1 histidinol-phosphate phosphatase [Actinoplanes sp. SE50/110]ATO84499.1 histidinol phosphate phosphatase [Actinoplanes sp. SE50]SLM01909.1 histidinol phosphate phosphatase [Actinoplanes sp. SE50/110]